MNKIEELIINSLVDTKRVLEDFISNPQTVKSIECVVKMIVLALKNNKKIICCGNGGSLCDATHFAEELTGRYRKKRYPLPAIAINDPAYITCVANDFDFDEIFSRYVEALGQPGDILFAISTSGTSQNVIKSVIMAKERKMKVISLTQEGKNQLAGFSDVVIAAPHTTYADRIQEIHIKVLHILIESIEAIMESS